MTASPTTTSTFYASLGSELAWYDLDVADASVERRGAVQLPGSISYAWPHPSRRTLYVSSGNASGDNPPAFLSALRIEADGALTPLGAPTPMPARATHITVDGAGTHVFAAHNRPPSVTVRRIEADGAIGEAVAQPADLDCGTFPHQVRVMPSDRSMILVSRGFDPSRGRPESPGALKVMSVRDGVLADQASIAPNGGYGFGVRHLDFHPTKPWLYVSVERHNALLMLDIGAGDALPAAPIYTKGTLSRVRDEAIAQGTGAIHVHPDGGTVYLSNRSDGEGEDNIAVFSIDPATGEPALIQHADTQSLHIRTFAIDPTGQLLIATSIHAYDVRDGAGTRTVPGGITVFRIGADGRLDLARKYDIDAGERSMTWSGIIDRA